MKQVYLFVEGPISAQFLRRILPPDFLTDAEFVPGRKISENLSLARSLLVVRKKPVVVLMNAASLDPDVIAERRESTEELIRAADGSIPVKVIAVVPEIEAWFFAAPEAVERELGAPVTEDFVFLGKRDPKGVLQQLAAKNQRTWDSSRVINSLDDADINQIRALPEVIELSTFLKQLQKNNQAA